MAACLSGTVLYCILALSIIVQGCGHGGVPGPVVTVYPSRVRKSSQVELDGKA